MAVTGAASGIGRAIARPSQAGDIVHAGDISRARLGETARSRRRGGPGARHVLDVTDLAAVEAFVAAADDDGDGLAVFGQLRRACSTATPASTRPHPELWRRVIDVNLTGCFHGCRPPDGPAAVEAAGQD